jgi:hypothetical protein
MRLDLLDSRYLIVNDNRIKSLYPAAKQAFLEFGVFKQQIDHLIDTFNSGDGAMFGKCFESVLIQILSKPGQISLLQLIGPQSGNILELPGITNTLRFTDELALSETLGFNPRGSDIILLVPKIFNHFGIDFIIFDEVSKKIFVGQAKYHFDMISEWQYFLEKRSDQTPSRIKENNLKKKQLFKDYCKGKFPDFEVVYIFAYLLNPLREDTLTLESMKTDSMKLELTPKSFQNRLIDLKIQKSEMKTKQENKMTEIELKNDKNQEDVLYLLDATNFSYLLSFKQRDQKLLKKKDTDTESR